MSESTDSLAASTVDASTLAADEATGREVAAARRRYVSPRLQSLGSVRDLTLGASGKTHDVGTHTKAP